MSDTFPYPELAGLHQSVQRNCHIADASFAGDFTLCIYLLKMREFFRWESGLDFSEKMDNSLIGKWLSEREQLWESLAGSQFVPLVIGQQSFDPFDTDGVNQALAPYKLVYSGGLGMQCKPHFFLAQLIHTRQEGGYTAYIANREYAREISAPPAMALGNTIFIRRESLKRMLWEKIEEWRWNQPDNAMARALAHYDFEQDLDAALESMTENELNSLLLHEIGEVQAGQLLGQTWQQMLSEMPRSKAEIMLRAIRDHIADGLSTLPMLLQRQHQASLHFYFANLSNMRKHLYPALLDAYQHWHQHDDLDPLQSMVSQGLSHWQSQADGVMDLYRRDGLAAQTAIETLLEASRL